ncbi:MAG TPA: MmgE/PrpD family protein [Firmicutes bacterium]|nr:MmgE/PrpD family protein [Bacillota bacterium]
MSVLEELVGCIVNTDFTKLEPETLERARYCLLDALGCGLLGSSLPEGRALSSAMHSLCPDGSAPVWGTAMTLPADQCALACGTFCHMRELDDVHYSIVHPGAVCVPAAVAVAHTESLTLGQLLRALVIGYEVMVRVSKGTNYINHRRLGWHATASCGSFGAAAATASLLVLDARRFAWALGIAGSRTGGTWAFAADGSMSKRLHPGLASRDGVLSAYLARAGFTGPVRVLEAEDGGFFRATSDEWNLEEVTAGWGKSWAIDEVEFKWYAACKSVHSPVEAAMQIRENAKRRGKQIAPLVIRQVTVRVNSTALSMAGGMYDPASVASAQISIPYGVAVALLGGECDETDYTPQKLNDSEIFSLASKVRVVADSELDELRVREHKSAAEVVVTWDNGEEESCRVQDPKGSLGHPISKEMLISKFLRLASAVIGTKRARELCELVTRGTADTAVRRLTALLAVPEEMEVRD